MIQCAGFNIDWVNANDAKGISYLVNKNAEAFRLYFPMTLAANTNEAASKVFISKISEATKAKKQFLFTLKRENTLIGLVYIKELDWDKKEGEFAYCMDTEYGGKGFMTQAIKALSKYAFANYELETLKIIVHHTNIPSVKVAQNNGFQFTEILKKSYTPPNGTPLDMDLYELKK